MSTLGRRSQHVREVLARYWHSFDDISAVSVNINKATRVEIRRREMRIAANKERMDYYKNRKEEIKKVEIPLLEEMIQKAKDAREVSKNNAESVLERNRNKLLTNEIKKMRKEIREKEKMMKRHTGEINRLASQIGPLEFEIDEYRMDVEQAKISGHILNQKIPWRNKRRYR